MSKKRNIKRGKITPINQVKSPPNVTSIKEGIIFNEGDYNNEDFLESVIYAIDLAITGVNHIAQKGYEPTQEQIDLIQDKANLLFNEIVVLTMPVETQVIDPEDIENE